MRAALSHALIALSLTSAAATYPTSSEDVSSALLTVWRRHPSHFGNFNGPVVSVSKARYDCSTSKTAQTWTDLKRYMRVRFRSHIDGFREYVPPPSKLDPAGLHHHSQNAQEIPLQRRAPAGQSGRAGAYAIGGSSSSQSSSGSNSQSLSLGAIVGIVVGILVLAVLSFTIAFAWRRGRRRSRPSASEYLRKTPTWKSENAYSQAYLSEQPATKYGTGQGSLAPASFSEADRPVTPPPELRTKHAGIPQVPMTRGS